MKIMKLPKNIRFSGGDPPFRGVAPRNEKQQKSYQKYFKNTRRIIMEKNKAVVIDEFHIHKYQVLVLDNLPMTILYYKFRIKGILYDPVPVYDLKNCIAIESNESFLGEIVEFV